MVNQADFYILCADWLAANPDRRDLMIVYDPEKKLPSKAVLPMLGKRVLDWQLEAMIESPDISDIYLIGLSPDEFPSVLDLKYIQFERNSSILGKDQIRQSNLTKGLS